MLRVTTLIQEGSIIQRINALRTGDADLRFYITTARDGGDADLRF